MKNRKIIGRLEHISLPELGIKNLIARVDTGAQTSSLHVDNIKHVVGSDKPMIEFDIHPDVHNVNKTNRCRAYLHDVKKIKSSNGQSEERYVIRTLAVIGDHEWDIKITLTNRADMTYLMLVGREALGKNYYVDPSRTFVASVKV
ncbi:ATP-dependent zinc protease [Shewanella sp. OPT22]|nr:ATP-dependent zinc protease [Shewanella sp. OPT22]